MIKPRPLRRGDKVAAVTLSWGGPGAFPHRYEVGREQLEEALGVQVVETKHALADPEWIYRNPRARADDLMEALIDPSIRAIVSTIGGDDSVRVLPHIDLDTIRANPKIFMGYSDTTMTHMAFYKAGVTSFYGPSVMAGFAENAGTFQYMVDSIRRTLFRAEPIGVIAPNRGGWTVEHLDWGSPENQTIPRKRQPSTPWRFLGPDTAVRGPLVGGCADSLEILKGTPYFPSPTVWDDAILFLEMSEAARPPEQLQDWLRSYGTLDVLRRLGGILFGRPGGGIPQEDFVTYDDVLLRVLEEFGAHDVPIVTNMDFGHTDPMFVIPYGIEAEIDPTRETVRLVTNAVED